MCNTNIYSVDSVDSVDLAAAQLGSANIIALEKSYNRQQQQHLVIQTIVTIIGTFHKMCHHPLDSAICIGPNLFSTLWSRVWTVQWLQVHDINIEPTAHQLRVSKAEKSIVSKSFPQSSLTPGLQSVGRHPSSSLLFPPLLCNWFPLLISRLPSWMSPPGTARGPGKMWCHQ